MDPRRLVGMTMGARKRRARAELRVFLTLMLADLDGTPFSAIRTLEAAQRQQFRAKYRIGERLRPCPGCSFCDKDPGSEWCCDGPAPARTGARATYHQRGLTADATRRP